MVSYLVPRSRKFFKSTNLEQHSKKKNYDKNTFSRRNSSSSSNSETYNYCSRLFFRRATSVNKSETKTSADPVKGLENKSNQYENIISVLWSWISFSLNILTLGILEWQWHKRKCIAQNVPRRASEFQMMMYCALPLRLMSRCWGWLASCYVPEMLRPYLYGWYSNTFNVNIEEALYPDYKHYRSLSEFFTRSLRDGVRPVDATAPVVSPADGRILHYGVVTSDSYIEQVKGVNYKMQDFLGPPLKENNDECENYALALKKHKNDETQLYQCVIYLAPGDYHRFHSATSWIPKLRRHFSGKLLSVNPKVASWMPGLFCLNERVTYIGNWQHGFFSYTAVGATNVGSVQIYIDDKLKTNNWRGLRLQRETRNNNPSYDEVPIENVTAIEKGQLLGQFNMGSTIVLIFEAPKNFVFDVEAGKKILVGQPLGHLQ